MSFLERHELVARMEWMLRLGALGMSSVLAPTILGTVCLDLVQDTLHTDDVLRWLLVTITLSTVIAGLVMHIALAKRSGRMLFGLSCLGGFLFVVLTGGLYELLDGEFASAGTGLLVGATFGAVLSIPCGGLFGLLFLGMFVPTQKRLADPAQDSLAHTANALARVLLIASAIAMLAVSRIEGPYCSTFFSLLSRSFQYEAPEGTDIAWTRYLIGAPFVIAALALSLYAHLEQRRLRLLRESLGRRDLNDWNISDLSPTSEAMPLTEADRSAPHKLLLEDSHSDLEASSVHAYRHHARPAAVYIGIIAPPELPQ